MAFKVMIPLVLFLSLNCHAYDTQIYTNNGRSCATIKEDQFCIGIKSNEAVVYNDRIGCILEEDCDLVIVVTLVPSKSLVNLYVYDFLNELQDNNPETTDTLITLYFTEKPTGLSGHIANRDYPEKTLAFEFKHRLTDPEDSNDTSTCANIYEEGGNREKIKDELPQNAQIWSACSSYWASHEIESRRPMNWHAAVAHHRQGLNHTDYTFAFNDLVHIGATQRTRKFASTPIPGLVTIESTEVRNAIFSDSTYQLFPHAVTDPTTTQTTIPTQRPKIDPVLRVFIIVLVVVSVSAIFVYFVFRNSTPEEESEPEEPPFHYTLEATESEDISEVSSEEDSSPDSNV